jgi:hypothetical protein
MAKAITTPSAVSVTPFAVIQKLTQGQALEQFVAESRAAARMFVLTAKLILHLALTVKKGQTVGGLLAKSGIRKTTIDNARQAARVFEELVLPPQVAFTEAQYDRLTFAECLVINRSMSGTAKEKQSATKIVALMKKHPSTWDEEIESLTRHGHSVKEQLKIEKAAAKEAAAKAARAASEDERSTDAGTTEENGSATSDAKAPASKKTAHEKVNAATAIGQIEALEAVFNSISPIEAAKALPALSQLHGLVTKIVGSIAEPKPRKVIQSGIKKTGKTKKPAKLAA